MFNLNTFFVSHIIAEIYISYIKEVGTLKKRAAKIKMADPGLSHQSRLLKEKNEGYKKEIGYKKEKNGLWERIKKELNKNTL